MLRFAASISGRQTAGEVMRALVDTVRHAVLERGLEPADLRSLAEERLTEAATLDEQLHYYALFRAPRLLAGSLDQVFRSSRQDVAQTLSLFPSLVQDSMDLSRALMTVSGPQESEGDETSFTDAAPSSRPRELAEPALPGSSPQVQVLTNGLTVSVHTRPEAEVFAIHLLARNRSALEPEGRDGLADAVHRLLLRGTLARDAGALSAELARIGASVKFHDDARFPFDDYRTTPAYSFAVLETRRDHAAAALRLFAEILQTPRFAAEEVARTEGIMQDLAARSRESSSALAADAFRGMVAPGHPLSRSVSGSRRSLAGLTRQEVMAMHARLFAPENLILSIRGGGDPGAVMSQVEASYGGRGTAGGFTAKEPAHGDGEEPVAVVPTVATPAPAAGSEAARFMVELGKAQSSLRMGAVLTVPPAMQAPLAAAVLVLSDRLQMSVREEQGLAYSVGAHLQSLGSGSALVTVALGTAPEHLAAAEDAVLQAARLLAEEPPPADEVQRVIAARRGRILMRRLPSQNQAMYDGLDLFRGEPSEGSLQALAALSRVTPAQIRQAARHLQPSRWAVAVAR